MKTAEHDQRRTRERQRPVGLTELPRHLTGQIEEGLRTQVGDLLGGDTVNLQVELTDHRALKPVEWKLVYKRSERGTAVDLRTGPGSLRSKRAQVVNISSGGRGERISHKRSEGGIPSDFDPADGPLDNAANVVYDFLRTFESAYKQ